MIIYNLHLYGIDELLLKSSSKAFWSTIFPPMLQIHEELHFHSSTTLPFFTVEKYIFSKIKNWFRKKNLNVISNTARLQLRTIIKEKKKWNKNKCGKYSHIEKDDDDCMRCMYANIASSCDRIFLNSTFLSL